jgi:hypothetical protein
MKTTKNLSQDGRLQAEIESGTSRIQSRSADHLARTLRVVQYDLLVVTQKHR